MADNALLQWLPGMASRRNSLLDGAPMYQGGPQLSVPMPAANFVPQQRPGLAGYGDRALNPQTPDEQMASNVVRGFAESPAAIRAFHGSPHQFDRFDMSNIGTGEGNQSFGHGLYFAESEGVAQSYRDALSGAGQWGKYPAAEPTSYAARLANMFENDGSQFRRGDRHIVDLAKRFGSRPVENNGALEYMFPDGSRFIHAEDGWEIAGKAVPGHMYEVNLNTDPSRLLDWDAPLASQSPHVQDAVNRVGREPGGALNAVPEDLRGSGYSPLVNDPAAVAKLRAAGVDGVRYLDANSRAAADGTRNVVMFDDSLVNIVRRYGLNPLMVGGAGAAAASD